MKSTLSVYIGIKMTGSLQRDGVTLSFAYNTDYLNGQSPLPLSRQLPLQAGSFGDSAAKSFFANLLPEGAIRIQVARQVGVSPENVFGLLEAIGGDCAGALSLVNPESNRVSIGNYRPITADALALELANLPAHPFLAGEDGVRLSLAGAQNKLPIYYDGNGYFIPEGINPSSHIIKTAIPQLENSVANEAFCMNLAARVGLPTPAVEIVTIGNTPVYLVERYDRQHSGSGTIERLHQEDFCQALGIAPEMKYEKEGGPGFQDCFQLVEEWSSEPLLDIQLLLNWSLFNFIVGNADAHGKNLSFLYRDGVIRLAPFYDIISTAVYERINNKFAMKMGGQNDPRYLQWSDLKHFAAEIGIDIRTVKSSLKQMVQRVEAASAILADEYRKECGTVAIIDDIQRVISRRIGKARSLAA
jgi:serine/threonine-protein kinase HipA